MKHFSVLLFVFVLLVYCKEESQNTVPKGFKSEVMLRVTPIKDQGRSPLCWIYAMLATIETEHLGQGDSVNLSVDYISRMFLEEQAMKRFRTKGRHDINMRGMAPMAIDLLQRYGAMPYDSYYSCRPINYNVISRKIEKTVDMCLANKYDSVRCLNEVRYQLNANIGYMPRMVFMFGVQYTFLEFAHSVCLRNEYESLTSLASEKMNTVIRLPFADNHYDCTALNIPADSLIKRMEHSLRNGHPVLWEGGPNDNHAVAVIGMGNDSDGTEYFVAKNSWGIDNPTRGLLYIRKDYAKNHTSVIVAKRHNNKCF